MTPWVILVKPCTVVQEVCRVDERFRLAEDAS